MVACFFGDGSSNEGAIHEAMNLAAVWNLPVLFILVNNTYGMSTPLNRVVHDTDLTKRSVPYGMKCLECDGNDVLAVYQTVQEAREYAVSGQGPVLVVEHTYRTSGHSKSDGNQYRTKEEIQYWKERNPIIQFRKRLLEEGLFSQEELDDLQREADAMIDLAVAYAKAQPQPSAVNLEADVYAE